MTLEESIEKLMKPCVTEQYEITRENERSFVQLQKCPIRINIPKDATEDEIEAHILMNVALMLYTDRTWHYGKNTSFNIVSRPIHRFAVLEKLMTEHPETKPYVMKHCEYLLTYNPQNDLNPMLGKIASSILRNEDIEIIDKYKDYRNALKTEHKIPRANPIRWVVSVTDKLDYANLVLIDEPNA